MSRDILIIEDSRIKTQAIKDCLNMALEDVKITTTDTILIGGRLLSSQVWHGIVLDLAFQRTQQLGDELERPYLAGLNILQQANELRLSTPIIIATQHSSFRNTPYGHFETTEELTNVLKKAFKRNFRQLIEVELPGTAWQSELIKAAKEHFL